MIYARILPPGPVNEEAAQWIVGNPSVDAREFTPNSGEELQFLRSQQSVNGASWLKRKMRDQMNQGVELMLSTVRRFADALECFVFRFGLACAADADKPHRMVGHVVVRCQSGGEFAEFILSDALVLASAAVPVGKSLALTYGIKGGSAEPYRSGLSLVPVAAPLMTPASKGSATLFGSLYTEDAWYLSILVYETSGPGLSYTYLVDSMAEHPPIASGGIYVIFTELQALGADVVMMAEDIILTSHSAGEDSLVQMAISHDGLPPDWTASGQGTPDEYSAPEPVTVTGDTVTADVLNP